MRDPSGIDPPGEAGDTATWSADETGSHAVDRELERELVRAALFDGHAAPRVGRFAVGERIGAGSSSVVYAAWDDLLARQVAVKVFVAESSARHPQFLREAHALGQLRHGNVVAVYEVGEWRGHAFIAMELIAGTTLARWQSARRRSIHEILDVYLQAGHGLAAAHHAGLVHRDFKPANVMVASGGRVVVTDFGLAGNVEPGVDADTLSLTIPGSAITTHGVIGTPAYVAPEQRRGATPHPSADIYSFSLALCEALIGWHPMREPDPVWQHALARRVPRPLHDAICAGLAAQPAARGDTMAPLLAALTIPPRRTRRGVAIAVAGLTAAGAAVGFQTTRDSTPASAGRDLPPPFRAPSLRALVRQIDAIAVAPPRSDDPAAAALRALALAPLPTELRCAWPAPLTAFALGEQHAIGLDDRGRVYACALDTGAISLAATGARCIAPGPAATIGMFDQGGRLQVVQSTGGAWHAVRVTAPIPVPRSAPAPTLPCAIDLVPERDGTVRAVPGPGLVAADRAGRIAETREHDELRIIDRSGALVSRHALARSPSVPSLDVSRDGARALAVTMHGPLLWWDAGTGWHEEPLEFQDPTLGRARLSPGGARALLVTFFGSLEVRHLGGGTADWLAADSVTDAVFLDDSTVIASDSDHRLWRWDLADARSGIVAIHDGATWSVASNPEIVVSGSEAGTLAVVDRRTGTQRRLIRLACQIYKILLDGEHLIAGGSDGLRIWSWRAGALDAVADTRGLRIWDVEAGTAGDGSRVYLAGALTSSAVFAWDTRAPAPAFSSSSTTGRISDLAVSSDGRTAAAVNSQGSLMVLDVAARRAVFEVAAHPAGAAYRAAFDPTTETIVTVGEDGYLRTWAPPERTPRRSVQISRGAVYGLDVHTGRAVTTGYDGGVTLVDLASGQIVRRYHGHNGAVRTVQFRAGGAWFVTGGVDHRACLWRIDKEDCHTWLDGHTDSVLGATFADDGTIFTASSDGTVRYWRPSYDQPIEALAAEVARHGSRR